MSDADNISSMADFVSSYVEDLQVEVTGELIADGVQFLLMGELLMQGRRFTTHCRWNEPCRGFDVIVTVLAPDGDRVIGSALLPQEEVDLQAVDQDAWADYMKRFVKFDLMVAIRRKRLDITGTRSAPWDGGAAGAMKQAAQSMNALAAQAWETHQRASEQVAALQEIEELKSQKLEALKSLASCRCGGQQDHPYSQFC